MRKTLWNSGVRVESNSSQMSPIWLDESCAGKVESRLLQHDVGSSEFWSLWNLLSLEVCHAPAQEKALQVTFAKA